MSTPFLGDKIVVFFLSIGLLLEAYCNFLDNPKQLKQMVTFWATFEAAQTDGDILGHFLLFTFLPAKSVQSIVYCSIGNNIICKFCKLV
jgi:hypothetical protein